MPEWGEKMDAIREEAVGEARVSQVLNEIDPSKVNQFDPENIGFLLDSAADTLELLNEGQENNRTIADGIANGVEVEDLQEAEEELDRYDERVPRDSSLTIIDTYENNIEGLDNYQRFYDKLEELSEKESKRYRRIKHAWENYNREDLGAWTRDELIESITGGFEGNEDDKDLGNIDRELRRRYNDLLDKLEGREGLTEEEIREVEEEKNRLSDWLETRRNLAERYENDQGIYMIDWDISPDEGNRQYRALDFIEEETGENPITNDLEENLRQGYIDRFGEKFEELEQAEDLRILNVEGDNDEERYLKAPMHEESLEIINYVEEESRWQESEYEDLLITEETYSVENLSGDLQIEEERVKGGLNCIDNNYSDQTYSVESIEDGTEELRFLKNSGLEEY